MKEEIARIMKLVQEGKLSPEDAAELIDAFQGKETVAPPAAGETSPPAEPKAPGGQEATEPAPEAQAAEAAASETDDKKGKDPLQGVVDFIEGIGREVSTSVNWKEVSQQIRGGTQKGLDALKKAAEEIKAGHWEFGFGPTEMREVVLPITVGDGKILKIENPCGSIKVTGGHEAGTITARAKVRGTTAEDAKTKAEAYTLVIEESDHTVLVRQPRIAALQVDMVIQLAASAMVEIRSESGTVEVFDTGAGVKVVCQSGDVSLRGLDGAIDVSVQSGSLLITDCKSGAASIESKSGNADIKNFEGNLNARCASGNFNVSGWSGKTFSVESVSGDVAIDLATPVTGTVNIRTVNGDTSVSIADGGDARVSLSTLRGEVSCNVELQDEARTEQRVTGRLGSGAGTLDVSGINGDISLKLHDSA